MEEKPLHVRVAEALGCTTATPTTCERAGCHGYKWQCHCGNEDHNDHPDFDCDAIPEYDTDWSATGPLIEKYHLHVGEEVFRSDEGVLSSVGWFAGTWESEQGAEPQWDHLIGRGETPLLAVCNLLLELAKAGKL